MIQIVHYSLSILYLALAIISIFRYTNAWIKGREVFTNWDEKLAFSLLVTLYFQLIMGVYLFYNTVNEVVIMHNDNIQDRFWPIEHFFVMFFSILSAQLGYIYSKNVKDGQRKFRTLSIYYTISFVLVIFSLGMILL